MTKRFLLAILLLLHGIMVCSLVYGYIRNEWTVILYSLVVSGAFLTVYSSTFEKSSSVLRKKMREIVIYWESALTLALRAVVAA